MIFVDTGAWFAYFVRRDSDHKLAQTWMCENTSKLVTSDYVLDELLTLLKIRESNRLAIAVGQALFSQSVCHIEKVNPQDIEQSWQAFQHYQDKGWSFTDCTSKVVMERLGIQTAFAFDHHFEQFGQVVRVPIIPV